MKTKSQKRPEPKKTPAQKPPHSDGGALSDDQLADVSGGTIGSGTQGAGAGKIKFGS